MLYDGAYDGSVFALDAKTGKQLWKVLLDGLVNGSAAVAGGVVYVPSAGTSLYALDAKTGKALWHYATGGQIYSSPALAQGLVFIGSRDGSLYAFGL